MSELMDITDTYCISSCKRFKMDIAPPGVVAGDMVSSRSRFVDPSRASNLLAGLVSMYKDKQFVDVTLTAVNRDFDCHRNILAISSPYFMTMFLSNLAESQQKKVCI